MLSILFLTFIFVVVIQVGYYGFLFTHFSFAKRKKNTNTTSPVSVLISCKNEEKNIATLLTHILKQDYPNFEIVLVDDASTDKTLSIIKEFAVKHEIIQYSSIPQTPTYSGNKKKAATLAIQKANYEYLLFTDADCIPESENWIRNMSAQFSNEKHLVLGYGAYKKRKGLFNKLVRYETVLTAWQYFSYANIGLPYMGVGRNIGYTKSLFKSANGFTSHQHIRSGDDDLFVNQIGTKKNTTICWEKDTHTLSVPKKSISEWLHQKRRHITTANKYKPIHQILLGFFYVAQLMFFSLFFVLILTGFHFKTLLILIGIRYLFFFISFIPTTRKLNEKDLVLFAPFLELFLILVQLRIFITNLFKKPTKW